MVASQSLTISRAVGGALVISNTPPGASTDFHLPEGGLAYPDFDFRLTFAPDQDSTPGKALLAVALDAGTLPLTIECHGTSTANLQTNRRALEAAFSQQSYTVTIEVDGQTETYDAFPAWPKWGAINSGHVARYLAVATLSVTVNPA